MAGGARCGNERAAVKTAPIVPARIVSDDDGTPRSADYGDIYHPRSGALAQARHVFLDGAALAARWRNRARFVVLETGFGLGNNFLATWSAWRADPGRSRQLHFISIEQAPPTRATIASIGRDAVLAPLADELGRRWPPLTCNLHRLAFDGGAVELLLAFGAVDAWLPQIVGEVDAFFLDGFAPARNPAMWDARLFKAMARLAAADATVATWSAARVVRDGLRGAGFEVEKAPGSAGKRDITRPARPAQRDRRRRARAERGADRADRRRRLRRSGARRLGLVRRDLGVGRRRWRAARRRPAAETSTGSRPCWASAPHRRSNGSAAGGIQVGERRPLADRRRGARGRRRTARRRLRRRAVAPRRSVALRRAGAGAVRVLRARLARHRVGSARRGDARCRDRCGAAAGRGRPARCDRPGALRDPGVSARRCGSSAAARRADQPPVGPIAGSAGA
jgi:tRNA U34 5-methylaminomethyl-2-thiouridine-forming methyltransferase MnmC